jgi:hypothetical protein
MFRVIWLSVASGAPGQIDLDETIILQNATSLRNAIEESVLWHEPKYSRMDGFTIIRDGKAVYRSPRKSF